MWDEPESQSLWEVLQHPAATRAEGSCLDASQTSNTPSDLLYPFLVVEAVSENLQRRQL